MKTILTTLLIIIFSITATDKSFAQQDSEIKKTNIRVRNLHCDDDMPTIKTQLLKQDGVMEVSYTVRKSGMAIFSIKYHEAGVDKVAIEKFIEDTPGCDDKSTKPYRVIKEKVKTDKSKEEQTK